MSKYTRRKRGGGTLVLKKGDTSLQQQVRTLGGERVGLVPIDVSKQRISAMVTDFYCNQLAEPAEYAVSARGLDSLVEMVEDQRRRHGLKLVVAGIEQTGRLHEPVKQFLEKHWMVKMIHPLVTSSLRQGVSPNIKTEGIDLEAIGRALIGCFGTTPCEWPLAFERWRALHRARGQMVDDRASLKQRMHDRLHAVLPGFASLFGDVWSTRSAVAAIGLFDSPGDFIGISQATLCSRLKEHDAPGSVRMAEKLQSWAADAAPASRVSATEAGILRDDLGQLAYLTGRVEDYERKLLSLLVETPFVLLLSMSGISHVIASGIGASAGPMGLYATSRSLTGRAGLYSCRYQSDLTDRQGGMGRGEPFLRDALMKAGRCLTMPGGAFFAWGDSRRRNGWNEKRIIAAMANRLCGVIHVMVLKGETFRHPDAKPGVSVLGKLLNVAADLGIEAAEATRMALQVADSIPRWATDIELEALKSGAWMTTNRPKEHGASPGTTRQIKSDSVPVIVARLERKEDWHEVEPADQLQSP